MNKITIYWLIAFCVLGSNAALSQSDSCFKHLHDDINDFFVSNYATDFTKYKDSVSTSINIEMDSLGAVLHCKFPKYKGAFITGDILSELNSFLLTKNYNCMNEVYIHQKWLKNENRSYHYEFNPSKAAKIYK